MSNSGNQTSIPSNTAEIVENESRGSLTPFRWSNANSYYLPLKLRGHIAVGSSIPYI